MNWSPQRRLPAPAVDIRRQSPLWDAEAEAVNIVRAAIQAAVNFTPAAGEISVLLADDETLRQLNNTWRGIDKPTNVLSFPAAKAGGALIGDIALAFETVAREAAAEGKSFGDHLAHLTVHGFLHLMGYDHATDSQADAMEGLERAALSRLRIADPYRAPEPGHP
jgi:probable rRNA maturation factor